MSAKWKQIDDPELAEQLYEAGLLWEHNIYTMVGHPPVPAHDWSSGAILSLLGSRDYPACTNWRLHIQLEE